MKRLLIPQEKVFWFFTTLGLIGHWLSFPVEKAYLSSRAVKRKFVLSATSVDLMRF
jgi:hypothetical protein